MNSLVFDGYRTYFTDQGGGVPIVFLHSAGMGHRMWDHQVAHFAPSNRVVALDFIGHGESERPDIVYTADVFVRQVEALVEHLALDRFHLAGCCLGGGTALEFARRHRDRIRSLVLVTATTPRTISSGIFGPFETLAPVGSRRRRLLGQMCETPAGRSLMARTFMHAQVGSVAARDRSFRDYAQKLYHSPGQWRVFTSTRYDGFTHFDGAASREEFPPMMVMWGGRNRILRAPAGRTLVDGLRPERSEFWDDCGYMLVRERPADVNRALSEFFGRAEGADAARVADATRLGD